MVRDKNWFSAKNIAYFAVLLALVVVFQTCGGFIQIAGLSLSFVLVPIVLGGILLGWVAGGILGFVFGFIVLMYGVAGAEPFTAALLADSPFMTVMICLVKGTAAGIVPALLYRLIAPKNSFAAAIVAAVSAPIVNTGLFIIGCLMISGTIASFTESGSMSEIVYFLFIGCAGWNFIIEFSINLVLGPAIHRIVTVVEKQVMRKKAGVEFYDIQELNEVKSEPQTQLEGGSEALPEGQSESAQKTQKLLSVQKEDKTEKIS